MSNPSKELDDVKKLIRSFLISSPNGLTVDLLCKDYRAQEGRELPYRKLGYPSASAFLRDCPDIADSSFHHGTHLLRGVADADTMHIQKLVARQKNTKKPLLSLPFKRSPGPGPSSVPPRFLKFKTQSFEYHTNNNVRNDRKPDVPIPPKSLSYGLSEKAGVVPAFLKDRLINFLETSNDSRLRLDNFTNSWRKRYGQYPEFKHYGFDSLEQLLKSLTNDIEVVNMGRTGSVVKLIRNNSDTSSPEKENSRNVDPVDAQSDDSECWDTNVDGTESAIKPAVRDNFNEVV